jgi:hypothetical protein
MSDYLWDPSADEADPEVEEFEEALSAMRYHAGTPEVPPRLEQALRLRRPRRFPRRLAAAAALAFMLLSTGLWLSLQSGRRPAPPAQQRAAVDESPGPMAGGTNGEASAPPGDKAHGFKATAEPRKTRRDAPRQAPVRQRVEAFAGGNNAGRPPAIHAPAAVDRGRDLYASNVASGEAAKAQIMLALQITSSKLNMAQRMAQGNAVP